MVPTLYAFKVPNAVFTKLLSVSYPISPKPFASVTLVTLLLEVEDVCGAVVAVKALVSVIYSV